MNNPNISNRKSSKQQNGKTLTKLFYSVFSPLLQLECKINTQWQPTTATTKTKRILEKEESVNQRNRNQLSKRLEPKEQQSELVKTRQKKPLLF